MNGFLRLLAESGASRPAADTAASAAAASDIFGPQSVTASPAAEILDRTASLTSSAPYHIAVVVLLLWYMLLLYRHPELVRAIRMRILSPDTSHSERLYDDRSTAGYSHFFGSIFVAGILFMCVLLVKYADILLPAGHALPAEASAWSAPVMAAVFCATLLYQTTLLWLTGRITVSDRLTSALLYIKELYFAFALFLLTPALLLYALCPTGEGRVWSAIIVLQVLFVTVLFLRETILLFAAKKVSILHWILYLCIVEVFPVTLFCLSAARAL